MDETVECWGHQGQPGPGHFLQISAGEFHICGVTKESAVRCWGGHTRSAIAPPAGQFVQVAPLPSPSLIRTKSARIQCMASTAEKIYTRLLELCCSKFAENWPSESLSLILLDHSLHRCRRARIFHAVSGLMGSLFVGGTGSAARLGRRVMSNSSSSLHRATAITRVGSQWPETWLAGARTAAPTRSP